MDQTLKEQMVNTSMEKKQTNPWVVMRAVLWSFFGVRSKSEYQADITRLSMKQLIIAGIFGAMLFVFSLVALVYFVTR